MLRIITALVALCIFSVSAHVRALSLRELIEQVKPAVAHIEVLDGSGEVLGSGSGFVIAKSGRIVTNHHVIEQGSRLVAVFDGGKRVEVTGVWGTDPADDLALLQLEPGKYTPLTLSNQEVRQGDEVVVVGSPRGFAGSVSTGIVSAVRQEGTSIATEGSEAHTHWGLQISAAISSGSSRSPVMNNDGEVVGVAVGVHTGGQALNFAVPVERLREMLASLSNSAQTQPTSLLVALRDAREQQGERGPLFNLVLSLAFAAFVLLSWLTVSRYLRNRARSARKK